jgi:hypothetical protein
MVMTDSINHRFHDRNNGHKLRLLSISLENWQKILAFVTQLHDKRHLHGEKARVAGDGTDITFPAC